MELALILIGIVATVYLRRAMKRAKVRRAERSRQRLLNPKRYGRRIVRAIAYRMFRSRFVWNPPSGPIRITDPVTVARRGLFRTVRIRIDKHILIPGLTGSGKSSTVRVLAAHVIAADDADFELWDLKPGSPEAELYAGKARCVTTPEGIVTRVKELLADPGRDGRALVISVDEGASVRRALSAVQLDRLATLVDIARHYRIFFLWGVQHPSRENFPSMLQANMGAVIAHRVKGRQESDVVFYTEPEWMPHTLTGPGACLVYEPGLKPVPLRALWLSEERFRALPGTTDFAMGGAPSSEPVTDPVPLIKIPDPVSAPLVLTGNQELVCFALELAERPLTEKEAVTATGLPQPRVNDALRSLTRKGIAAKVPDQYPALYQLTKEQS